MENGICVSIVGHGRSISSISISAHLSHHLFFSFSRHSLPLRLHGLLRWIDRFQCMLAPLNAKYDKRMSEHTSHQGSSVIIDCISRTTVSACILPLGNTQQDTGTCCTDGDIGSVDRTRSTQESHGDSFGSRVAKSSITETD